MRVRAETIAVEGWKEMMIAFANGPKETNKAVRETLRGVGDIVKVDAARRMAPRNVRTAVGYRTRVLRSGVRVQQSLKPTLVVGRRRPKWGGYQMRHGLLPALRVNEPRTMQALERAMDIVCDHAERIP